MRILGKLLFVQVVASIHQFVEGSAPEIRSGWRSLFGALRHLSPPGDPAEQETHTAAVRDVFEAFLSTESPGVFAHAALDCTVCLIKHIQAGAEGGLGEAALGYLARCHALLAQMFLLTRTPPFRGSEKIHTGSQPVFVSTSVPGRQVIPFSPVTKTEPGPALLPLPLPPYNPPPLLARPGLTRVWFLLVDGLVSALPGRPAAADQLGTALRSLQVRNGDCGNSVPYYRSTLPSVGSAGTERVWALLHQPLVTSWPPVVAPSHS